MSTPLFSDVSYVQPSELATNFKPLPTELYIRKDRSNIPTEIVNSLKEKLVTRPADGSLPIVNVNDALTFVTLEDGISYLINGNTRTRALTEMLNETKYSGFTFNDVPVREYLGDKSHAAIRQLQIDSNDSTNPHTSKDLIEAIEADYQYYIDNAPTNEDGSELSATKKSAYANAKLVESYKLTQVRIGEYRKIANAPFWFLQQVNADNIALDVAVDMLRLADKKGLPLQTVFAGTQDLLDPEKDQKITGKHLKKFVSIHLKDEEGQAESGSTDDAAEMPEGFAESGSIVEGEAASAKGAKPVDVEKLTSDMLATITAYSAVDLTALPADKVQNTIVGCVGAAASVVAALLGKQLINASRTVNTFDTIQTLLFDLLTGEDGSIALPSGLSPEELAALSKAFMPLGKQVELLTSVSDSEEVSEEDFEDDADLEDDNETVETEAYTLETV